MPDNRLQRRDSFEARRRIPRVALGSLLKAYSETETELAFICLGAGDFRVSVQPAKGPIRITNGIRDVRARIIEMRRIGEVERFRPKLHAHLFRNGELAEQSHVYVCKSRTS